MGIVIKGTGSYVPEKILTNADLEKMLWAIETQDLQNILPLMQNVFEDVASKESLELKKIIADCGADVTMLSGSGPAVFGLFCEEKVAEECCKKLCDMGVSAYLCLMADGGIIFE